MRFERALRRIVPSVSLLTFNPFFKLLVNPFSLPGRILFRELRGLPPNHMRIRVGTFNRLFFNEVGFYTGSRAFWLHAFEAGWCRLDSTIVDLGCGCGRYAYHLRDVFTGKYYGIDIDREMLEWCRHHFDAGRFTFIESTDRSVSYNRASGEQEPFRIPVADGEADLIFLSSLFTHLLSKELNNYLRESYRLLKPGGYAAHTCFCLDIQLSTYGNRHTFSHKIGDANVESLKQPEAAVAYSKAYLFECARQAGFERYELKAIPGVFQPFLVLRKGELTTSAASGTSGAAPAAGQ